MSATEIEEMRAGICKEPGRMRWLKKAVTINNYHHITTILQQEWRLWDATREWHEWRDVPIEDDPA